MRGGEIAQRVSASVSGGRAAVASPVWPSSLAGCKVAAAARWSIHLGASQQERERERLMAAIRARIKMVGPRQLYRLGSDGRVHCSSPFPVRRQNGRRRARRETETRHPSVFYIKHHPVVLIWQTPSMSSFLNLVNYSNGGKGKPTKSVSSVARRTKLICIMRWQVNRPLAMKKKGIQTRKRKPKAGTKQHSFGKIFK